MLQKLFKKILGMSMKQKIILGIILFLSLPLLIFAAMTALIFIPFIAGFLVMVFIILGLLKRKQIKKFLTLAGISFVVSFSSYAIADALFGTEEDTQQEEEQEELVVETPTDITVEEDSKLHKNDTINQVVNLLNEHYNLALEKEDVTEGAYDSKASLSLSDINVQFSDTSDYLFVDYQGESQENSDEQLIEVFKQIMSVLGLSITNDQFNETISELKTGNYQGYDELVVNNNEFTFINETLIEHGTRFTLKSKLDKDQLFKTGFTEYTIELNENTDLNEAVILNQSTETKVHFIDTGHSDAVLIENNGQFALIDAGDRDDDAKVKTYLQNHGVNRLDYLIITHFHADHFGAADTVVSDFEVGTTLVSNGDSDTQVYRDFINALANKGLTPSVPLEGAVMHLGSATLTFYNTKGGNSNENNNSLVTLLQSGSRKALFTGDAESQVEATLTSIGDIDLFKAGHHGSKTSNTASLLNRITPEHVVIMAGTNNKYGHPDAEVMNRFESLGIPVYRTDEQGSIIVTLSEEAISVDKAPGSYTPGASTESSSNWSSSSSNTSSNGGATTSTESQSTNESSTPTQNKDDNPNGVYNQETVAPKESYKNCTLLREVYPSGVPEGHPAYESKHDRDKDGWACEK